MPAVDKAILRVGIFEIVFSETPSEVAISEAVELAQTLSTEDSPAFINGVLATVSATRKPI
jgi:N utilization substance protein B